MTGKTDSTTQSTTHQSKRARKVHRGEQAATVAAISSAPTLIWPRNYEPP